MLPSKPHTPRLDRDEKETWVKQQVNEAQAWMRDLRKLGVSSAASYIFAGRRSTPQPPKDWADEVLYHHYCEKLPIHDSVLAHLEKADNAFLQLPDRRWYIKFRGKSLPSLSDNLGGLRCIHNLIKSNHLGTIVVRPAGQPICVFMPTSTSLTEQQQRRSFSRAVQNSDLRSCTLKSFAAMRSNQSHTEAKDGARVVESRSYPEAKQMMRAISKIAIHDRKVASLLNSAVRTDELGVWSFVDHEHNWVTEIEQISYDATLEKTPAGWQVVIPLSEESIEIAGHTKGMEYIARLLQLTGMAIPVALLTNRILLESILDRPPYQKLFKATQHRLVRAERFDTDPGTRQFIAAVESATGARVRSYEVTHAITNESPLAKYIPNGLVSLTPEGLNGVLYLLRKRLAAETMDGFEIPELATLVRDIDRAVKYVTRYEALAAQIEPESRAAADKVQKAVSSAVDNCWHIGENSLGKYFDEHIKTGKLCSHEGPWLWDVRGLGNFPDLIELASDHMYMKLRKAAREAAGLKSKNTQGGQRSHRVQ